MPRIFIINLLIFCKVTLLSGQNTLNDSLLFYEYAYYKSSDDTLKQTTLLKKLNLYLRENITSEDVFNEVKRVKINYLNSEELKADFLWNAATISYINNEPNYARFFLSEYDNLSKDTSVAFYLLSILVNKYLDTADVNKRIRYLTTINPEFNDLNCFYEVVNYNRKHLGFYLLSSAILPGSGTIMNGYVLNGIVSLALTAGSIYGVLKLVEYGLYANAFLWGTGVGLKFYAGNIKLTEQVFYKAENEQKNKLTKNCELKLKELLTKYPLTLRQR